MDLAGGTGDVSALIGPEVGAEGRVVLSDINGPMLRLGRDRLLDRGLASNVDVVLANAEQLPFPEDSFDAILIAFGLRNVTAKERALVSMHRVLRYGGRVVILEFSRLVVPLLQSIYDLYSFKVIPVLGQLIAGDKASYRYLVESIRMHPDQETLKAMMNDSDSSLRVTITSVAGSLRCIAGTSFDGSRRRTPPARAAKLYGASVGIAVAARPGGA